MDSRSEVNALTKEHPTLNTSKEVIRCPDTEIMTEAKIMEGLSEQRIVEVNICWDIQCPSVIPMTQPDVAVNSREVSAPLIELMYK